MELALQILFGVVAFICFTEGINLILKGTDHFLPADTPPQPRLDSIFRFLSGMYFGITFLLIWSILHIETTTTIIYQIGIIIICAGLGRLYSKIKIGSPGKHLEFAMFAEIALGTSMILLQYFR